MSKRRIAVLGGGVSTMSAVFELTDRPGWEEKFEIDVYQLGWRLGGKGASGRNMSGPEGIRGRIEEHGLHLWFGFYENAFAQIRRCYERAARPAQHPIPTWREAFVPQDTVYTHEFFGGRWLPWEVRFPANDSVPGQGEPYPDIGDLISMLAQWLLEAYRGLRDGDSPVYATAAIDRDEQVIQSVGVEFPVRADEVNGDGLFGRAVGHLADWVRGFGLDPMQNTDARRGYIVIDLLGAVLKGLALDRVMTRGFDQLDEVDFREWLRQHGASDFTLGSAFMAGTYDTVFGFLNGDPKKEVLAAGTGLRSGIRMLLGYKGHFMWKMTAGMGDIVFAPYYEVLARRGVRLHFFHRVTALRLSADGQSVGSVEMRRQATLKDGFYDPLISIDDLECWPSEPLYDQLVEGDELRDRAAASENVCLESYWSSWPGVDDLVLHAGVDYHDLVLGIPVAALPYLCADLIAVRPRWQRMVENIKTTRTMNAQLWLRSTVDELGWHVGPEPVLGGFKRPLCVWADLSHLLEKERWGACPQPPAHLAYMVGPMLDSEEPEPPFFADPEFPARELAKVRAATVRFLEKHACQLWPKGCDAQGKLVWDQLVDPLDRVGEARVDAQYLRANIDPNERYTLSVKGSTKYRLHPDDSGFNNLFLAGDWTDNGLNAGCVEAAVMSGMQVSRAIASYPEKIVAEDDTLEIL